MKIKVALGIFLTLISTSAFSSYLIEPHFGLNLNGSANATIKSINHNYDYNGTQYGLKLGMQNFGLMGGIDFNRSSFNLDDKTISGTVASSYKRNEWGLFIGYNFPLFLRFWGSYFFANTAKKSNGDEFSGTSKEFGLGFTSLPFVSLNLIFRLVDYSKQKISNVSEKLNEKINNTEIVLGLSLPFD